MEGREEGMQMTLRMYFTAGTVLSFAMCCSFLLFFLVLLFLFFIFNFTVVL